MSRNVEVFFVYRRTRKDEASSHRLKTLGGGEECLIEDYRTEPPTRYLIRNLGQSAVIKRTEAGGVLYESDLRPFDVLTQSDSEKGWQVTNALGMTGIILTRLGPDRAA